MGRFETTLSLGETTCFLFFGAISTAYCYFYTNDRAAIKSNRGASGGRVGALDNSIASVIEALSMGFELGAILLFSWCCENVPLWPHNEKFGSNLIFWGLFALFMFVALFTVKLNKNSDDTLLNRDQTEEWKGWMQYLFLAYHYFHYGAVYNYVRVFISCYVWLTGFGNVSFFYIKQDFGLLRFLQMIWRLNFLVFFLCLVHKNTYILYYICPLHTFYFCMTYVIMWCGRGMNIEWPPWLRIKFAIAIVLVYFVWEYQSIFYSTFGVLLGNEKVVGAKNGTLYEWYFRTALDHYSAIFGMAFAINFPTLVAWFKRAEEQSKSREIALKLLLCAPLAFMFVWWATNIAPKPKLQYNSTHPYLFWVPLLAYVAIRNSFSWLRKYHLGLLARMGKVTLETYLMQHHIWLAANAKALVVLVPGYPLVNLALVTVIYVFVSNRLFRITIGLRAMLLPNNLSATLFNLSRLGFALLLCAGIASIVCRTTGRWFNVCLLCSTFCLSYSFVEFIRKRLRVENVVDHSETQPISASAWRKIFSNSHWLVLFSAVFLFFRADHATNAAALSSEQESGLCASALGIGSWETKDTTSEHCSKHSVCFPEQNLVFSWIRLSNKQKTLCKSKPRVQAYQFFRPKNADAWSTFYEPQTVTFFGGETARILKKHFSELVSSSASGTSNVVHKPWEIEMPQLTCDVAKKSTIVIAVDLMQTCAESDKKVIESLRKHAESLKTSCPDTSVIWIGGMRGAGGCGRNALGQDSTMIFLNAADLLRGYPEKTAGAETLNVLSMTVANQIKFDQLDSPAASFKYIPHNRSFALVVLAVYLCIIICSDNFIGLSHVAFLFFGMKLIDLGQSYDEFHKTNGMVIVKNVDDEMGDVKRTNLKSMEA